MFRFLHIADVHLDTAFVCRLQDHRERLREALRVAFERSVDCAIDEEVDALLIAGDLFDGARLSFRTERALVEQCRRLDAAGIATVYVSGNHDPGGDQFRAAALPWPDRFHYVGGGEPVAVDVTNRAGERMARVVAAGHAHMREATNLAARFPPAQGGLPHVGLLHTMVTSAAGIDGHERYAPCTVDDLRRPGYDYWALGHVHLRQQVCDRPNAHYPGNIQGRRPSEVGPKGGLLVTLRDGMAPRVDFRDFAPVVWEDVLLDSLATVSTFDEIVERVRSEVVRTESGEEDGPPVARMLRVTLTGPSPLYARLRGQESLNDLECELGNALANVGAIDVEVRCGGLTGPVNLSEHRGQPHLLGEVLAFLDMARQDDELLDSLLPERLAGHKGVVEGDRLAYARRLLDGLEREAADRLLKDGT